MQVDYDLIPENTLETLKAWIATGRPMGSLCAAIVSCNLKEAFARADDENIRAMFHTVAWMYNNAPLDTGGRYIYLRDEDASVSSGKPFFSDSIYSS